MKQTISEMIREKRKKLKITQRELAEMIGKTRWDIANYENEKAIPPGDVLIKIQELRPEKLKTI